MEYFDEFGSTTAYIDEGTGKSLSYSQLGNLIKKTASGLQAKGLNKGEVVCIYSPNLAEYSVAFHATISIGGIVTPANPLYTSDELFHQLQDSNSFYLFTIPELLPRAKEAATKYGKIKQIFVFGDAEVDGVLPLSSLQNNDGVYKEVVIDANEDVAVMPYSSGTTGLPKGVMLTHKNLVSQVQMLSAFFGPSLSYNEHVIGFLPFYHIYAIVVFLATMLRYRATVVVFGRFDLIKFLTALQQHKCVWAFLVPPVVVAFAKHPIIEKYDLSSVKVVVSAAAPLGKELEEAVRARLKVQVVQAYGMTETTGATHLGPLDSRIKFGNAGILCPNVECKVVDLETRKEVEFDVEGEILLKGPAVMKGYFGKQETTVSSFEDGWLRTGDVGYVDRDGFIFIVDRVKELIKYKGYQVAPAELEGLALKHPAVADVAVIPVPDEEAGELPKAFVVLKEGYGEKDLEEIIKFVETKVAPHKKLRGGVELVKEIPKSASGKILRRLLVQKEREKKHNK
eukprot:TRINITY_DN8110_c0_g1_i2.p1 TRINITY_DN8110_c0_g1~~TRINITY_DN8110_c0_g1_i2.p1  ORF type:complete len:510 (-),score=162.24 TRINITY_DN8110_c0_g1_i2:90-1619(-)